MESESPATMASVVRWSKRKITLDGSASLANAVFLKFEREFGATATSHEIAEQISADEKQLFAILGVVEEVRP